jgi:hypothetical protein
MREPEMVGPEAGAVTSRGGRAVAGRYPTTVDGFAPISDFPALIPERGGSTHSRPSPEERNVGDVAPKLPAVLGSELEIAKGVGPRLPPRAIALLFFRLRLSAARRRSYSSAERQKTSMSRPDWMGAIR